MRLITLLTDFGMKDWFVGAMKGVILSLQPRATVVDITHEIPSGDVRAGALALAASYWLFPRGTVHLAVVDPGVGSQRKAIAVRTTDYVFLGPDNGVLSWALARQKVRAIHALENQHYFLRNVSRTFHGRDIFSPVAAHLSRGVSIKRLGPPVLDFQRLEWPEPRQRKGRIEGQVVYIDRFGNAITNIAAVALRTLGEGTLTVLVGRKRLFPVATFYQAVAPGRAVAVTGSCGVLEIAINGGNAARQLGLRVGGAVTVRLGEPRSA